MTSISKNARVAGALYLLTAVTAPFSLIYIPNTLFVHGNATATASNILASEMLFRAGIVVNLAGGVIFIFVAMALYRLFCGVNKTLASLMVGLVLASVTIGFVGVLNDIAALTLFRGADFLATFEKPQRDALGMLFLGLSHQGDVVNEIFWGLWLFPLAILTIRSGFLPKFMGWWLILNGFAYLILSLTGLLWPQYEGTLSTYAIPAELGELAFMLWLLIKGAKEQTVNAPAS